MTTSITLPFATFERDFWSLSTYGNKKMNLPEVSDSGSLVGIITGAIASLMWLRRRLSRDGVEVSKDSAESNLIRILQGERDKAMEMAQEAWATRTKDAQMIGKLSSEVESLTRVNNEMKERLISLQVMFQELQAEMRNNRHDASSDK